MPFTRLAKTTSEQTYTPKNVAETRWRTERGKYHYLRILAKVQKSGASADKARRRKHQSFLLLGDDQSTRFVLQAPILGAGPQGGETPPIDVQGDYSEFLRAYEVGFLYWLQGAGAGSKKASAAAFSRLLVALTPDAAERGLSGVLEEVYGAPLSNAEADDTCLEGRFLEWIAKQ